MFTREKQGELYIFGGAVLWGLFPIITILSYNGLPPLASLTGSTLFAACFFAVWLTFRRAWGQVKNKAAFRDIVLTTIFIAVLVYFFYFLGLRYTSAGNASIIGLTEILFAFLFFNIWKKEYISPLTMAGALLMILGAGIILSPSLGQFRSGDILILAANMVAPIGNYFQKRARARVSSETIMFMRSAMGFPIIVLLALLLGENASTEGLKISIPFLLINGIVLLGLSKIFWIEGIHRISVTKANALSAVSPLLTLFFAWLILHEAPTGFQLLAFFPMFFGVLLLSRTKQTI